METLQYWLNWIEQFRQWVFSTPDHIFTESSYVVNDVPYAALKLLATHFGEKVYPEDDTHRQRVYIEVWHGMSMTQIVFRSPEREFSYKKIKTT